MQFGCSTDTAWIARDLSAGLLALLDSLDGTRTHAEVLSHAGTFGVGAAEATRFLGALGRAGVIEDAGLATPGLRELAVTERQRLGPELAALSLAHRPPGTAARLLERRNLARVEITGTASIAPLLAALLSSAGIGDVSATSSEPITVYDVLPGGATSADVGQPLHAVAAARVEAARMAPPVQRADRPPPDLRILVARAPIIDPQSAADGGADGVPLLAVHARDLTGVVGPLVIPGVSACLHCLDLHRADRDPQWPVVAAQLAARRSAATQPVALLAVLAAHAVTQSLAYIDGAARLTTRNGTLELSAPEWNVRRRGWLPHADCGCVSSVMDATA